MGSIGLREQNATHNLYTKEILDTVHGEVGDEYKSYELDWMLALELRHALPYNHRTLECRIRCWHGMDDDICPLGTVELTQVRQCGHRER